MAFLYFTALKLFLWAEYRFLEIIGRPYVMYKFINTIRNLTSFWPGKQLVRYPVITLSLYLYVIGTIFSFCLLYNCIHICLFFFQNQYLYNLYIEVGLIEFISDLLKKNFFSAYQQC